MKIKSSVLTRSGRRSAGFQVSVLFLMIPALCILLIGSFSGCSKDSSDPGFPTPPDPKPDNFLFDVFGTGPNDVYVCGARGVMFHFDGTNWTDADDIDMGTSQAITTIWGRPDETTLYAVGHGGKIWRNTAGTWSGMASGTTRDIYGIGQFDGAVHAVGHDGLLMRLNGSTWSGLPSRLWILDENRTPTDTLSTNKDLASLVTVNEYFIGGAYNDPRFDGERVGTIGTKGMVMTAVDPDDPPNPKPGDPPFKPNELPDWILRPISGEQIVPNEWVYCTTSDPAADDRNFLGTSEGWLFRMKLDQGRRVWFKDFPSVTRDPARGIRDMWLDAAGNIYMVTDEGKVVFQPADYDFVASGNTRRVLLDENVALHGIWGTGPDNLFIVGNIDEGILRASHDQATDEFTVTRVDLVFPTAKFGSSAPAAGRFGELLE